MKNGLRRLLLRSLIGRAWLPVLFLLAATAAANAGDYAYMTNSDNTLTITRYSGSGGAVTIPYKTNGLPVTRIGDYAFQDCTALTSVTIHDSITEIRRAAFSGCTSLTDVHSLITVGDDAFMYGNSRTRALIPASVTNIGQAAFSGCTSLTSVTIPASVTSIGSGAFRECSILGGVYFEGNAPSDGSDSSVFCNATNATVYCLPGTTGWGSTFDGRPTVSWVQYTYTTNNSTITITQYTGFRGAAVGIPDTIDALPVRSIGAAAFSGSSLTGVTIPNSVISIGDCAFLQCTSLTNVTLGDGVTSIGKQAFWHCTRLNGVTIPAKVRRIGDGAFGECTPLTSIYFQGNAPSLGGTNVFRGADKATVYYLPGTAGWGSTFGGRPAALWNPQAQSPTAAPGWPAGNWLHQAFSRGPDEKVLELMKENQALIQEKDDSDCTPLHYAARYGRIETAKWLIAHKADVNTVSYSQFTPMHMVSDGALANFLIQAGADLKKKDAWSKTPLQKAAQEGRTNVCEVILASGFPIDLSSALRLGKRDLAKKMIKEKPAIAKEVEKDSDLWGNTSPLGVAASQGDKEMVELLLKAGAPVNAATERPNIGPLTALCNAVCAGHYEIAEILCKAGADCNMTGGTFYLRLLDYASEHSDKKMVDLLIKYGAKPEGKE